MSKKNNKNKIFTYWIDVAGSCNLECPSCPSGNYRADDFEGPENPTGFMDIDLFKQILNKIRSDDVSNNSKIHLYNWGEPLSHPKIGQLLQLAKDEGFYCGISSNLNLDKNLKEVVKAGPDYLRVSLSGYDQEVYEKGHRKGNINMVKSNLFKLRYLMDLYKSDFYVEVLHHIYRDNAVASMKKMIDLCNELDFNFSPVWAYLMPLEKNLLEMEDKLSEQDRKVRDRLALAPRKMFEVSLPLKDRNCNQQDFTMAINWNGSVQLCCNTFDYASVIAPSFLDTPHQDLQDMKYAHQLCDICMSKGLHVVMSYGAGEALDTIGNEALKANNAAFEIHQFSEPHIVRRDGAAIEVLGLTEDAHLAKHGKKPPRGLKKFLHKVLKK